jgi:hypothetical protein
MHGVLPAEAQRAIFPADSLASEKTFSDSLANEPENKWFSRLCERLWRGKPAAALDHLTSAKLHQCYRYASGRQEPPGLLIVELLQSPDGGRVLADIMRGSKQPWWQQHQFALAALPAVEQLRQLSLPLK